MRSVPFPARRGGAYVPPMAQDTVTRAGHVALVGRPNVGKSTLLNALTGEHLSIVTPRAQTTRERVLGIYTDAEAQIVFVDTPGLLDPQYLLQRGMLQEALLAIQDADAVLLLLDASRPEQLLSDEVLERLRRRGHALRVAINKVDAGKSADIEALAAWAADLNGREPMRISAARKEGLDVLRGELVAMLPESPYLYPPDEIAVQTVRFFVEELIRETVFELYEEEIPYSSAAKIEEYREAESPVYIRATVYVERESQKRIIIGSKGAGIRQLGVEARRKIEAFVGAPVYLDLWVKTLPGWRRKRSSLEYLGYPLSQAEGD